MKIKSSRIFQIILGFISAIPFAYAQENTAVLTAGAFKPVVEILNSLAYLLGNNATIDQVVKSTSVQPWQVVGLAFILVTATVAAALSLIKIFEKRKGAQIMLAVAMGIASVAAPGFIALVWSVVSIANIIIFVALLIFLYRLIWHSGSAAVAEQKSAANTAKAGEATSAKELYDAKKETYAAKKEYGISKKILSTTKRNLNSAKRDLAGDIVAANNVEKTLENIAEVLKKVQTFTGAPSAHKHYSELLHNRLAAASSTLTRERHTRTTFLQRLRDSIAAIHEYVLQGSERMRNLEELVQRAAASTRRDFQATVRNLQNRITDFRTAVQTAESELATMNGLSETVDTNIRDLIELIHSRNYPLALTKINETLSMYRRLRQNEQSAANLMRRITDLTGQSEDIDRQLQTLIRQADRTTDAQQNQQEHGAEPQA